MDVKQIAELYGVCDKTAYRWVRSGKFRHAHQVGRRWVVPAEEVTAGLTARQAVEVAHVLKSQQKGA